MLYTGMCESPQQQHGDVIRQLRTLMRNFAGEKKGKANVLCRTALLEGIKRS